MKYRGVVKFFSNSRGYGFLNLLGEEGEVDSKDIFVHYSSINCRGYKSLDEGQQVEFEIKNSAKGDEAINVVGL